METRLLSLSVVDIAQRLLLLQAQTQAAYGNLEAARQSRSMSVGLSIAAIITGVLIYFMWIIPTACCY